MVGIQKRLPVPRVIYTIVPLTVRRHQLTSTWLLLAHKPQSCIIIITGYDIITSCSKKRKQNSLLQEVKDESLDFIWAKTTALECKEEINLITQQDFILNDWIALNNGENPEIKRKPCRVGLWWEFPHQSQWVEGGHGHPKRKTHKKKYSKPFNYKCLSINIRHVFFNTVLSKPLQNWSLCTITILI